LCRKVGDARPPLPAATKGAPRLADANNYLSRESKMSPTRLVYRWVPRFSDNGRGLRCYFGPESLVAFFFSVAGLFVATQYEMPFKLSISTFHVSVMASTPATASHKAFHPS